MTVHERVYRRLEASERGGGAAPWRTIAKYALKAQSRGLLYRIFFFACFLPPLVACFMVYFAGQSGVLAPLAGTGAEAARAAFAPHVLTFFGIQLFFVTFFAAIAGGPVVAEDLRRRAHDLYFSKPVGAFDYAFGKWFAVFRALSVAMMLPLGLAGFALCSFVPDGFSSLGGLVLGALGAGALAAAVSALIVLGVSAFGSSARYAVVLWFVVSFFVFLAADRLVALTQDPRFMIASFREALWLIAAQFIGAPWTDVRGDPPSNLLVVGSLVAWCGTAGFLLRSRIRKAARS